MGKKEFKKSFIKMNQIQFNEGNLYQRAKKENTEYINNHINELERTTDEFSNQVCTMIDKMSNLPLDVIDDHFRVGLHIIYGLDGKKPSPHLFFAIYGGKVSKNRIVLKNVFIGNTYICDHCFTDINDKYIDDINIGDVVVVTAGVDFYDKNKNSKNKNTIYNYGLILMDDITKYDVSFDKVTQSIKYDENINVMITKIRELVTFHSINAALPIKFIDNFIISTLTCKQKEFDLMKGNKLEEIIPEEFNNLVLQVYSLVLSFINDNIYDFIFIQKCLVELIYHSGFSLYNYSKSLQCSQDNISDSLIVYLDDYNLTINKLSDDNINNIINNGFKFVKSLFH